MYSEKSLKCVKVIFLSFSNYYMCRSIQNYCPSNILCNCYFCTTSCESPNIIKSNKDEIERWGIRFPSPHPPQLFWMPADHSDVTAHVTFLPSLLWPHLEIAGLNETSFYFRDSVYFTWVYSLLVNWLHS